MYCHLLFPFYKLKKFLYFLCIHTQLLFTSMMPLKNVKRCNLIKISISKVLYCIEFIHKHQNHSNLRGFFLSLSRYLDLFPSNWLYFKWNEESQFGIIRLCGLRDTVNILIFYHPFAGISLYSFVSLVSEVLFLIA